MRPTVVGLTGPMDCGKDTVAQLLVTHARFSGHAFADALRAEICAAFAVDMELFTRRDLKEVETPALALSHNSNVEFDIAMQRYARSIGSVPPCIRWAAPRSPRQIMRWWANEFRRYTCSPDYWTDQVKHKVRIEQAHHQLRHVITDVRFPNEAALIRSMGGVIWQIKRPGRMADPGELSETNGDEFEPDAVINNTHDIRHLQGVVLANWMQAECHDVRWKEVANMGIVAVHELAEGAAA